MTQRIRVGVAGAGFGKRVHVPAFRADERCEVVAICATSFERAAKAAQEAAVARAFGNFREMLEKGNVDAVSIAAPPAAQPELIVEAARAGKHVLCEKPLAANEKDAARALDAAEGAGLIHAMDFIFPEIPAWSRAAAILKERQLGRLRHAALTWKVETQAFASGLDSWKTRNAEGGGALGNFMSHSFYYLEWLLGPFTRMAARLARGKGGDARVEAWMETTEGCPVTVEIANDAFRGPGHRLEVYGEDGSLALSNPTRDYVNGFTLSVARRASGGFSTEPVENFATPDGRIGAVSAIVRRFLDGVLTGSRVKPNLANGVRVQRLMAKAREADESGSWQSV
jgi:predicted dehydrogenase